MDEAKDLNTLQFVRIQLDRCMLARGACFPGVVPAADVMCSDVLRSAC